MKKRIIGITLVLLVIFSIISPGIVHGADGIGVIINNQALDVKDSKIISADGTLLVPANEMLSMLGGTFKIESNGLTGTMMVGENEIIMRLDNSIAKINGKYIAAPQPMKILNYRYLVPMEFIATKFGAECYFNKYKNSWMVFKPNGDKIIYKVMTGDTLWIVSQIYGVSIAQIKQLNGLSSDYLYVGQNLIIKNFIAKDNKIDAFTSLDTWVYGGTAFNNNHIVYYKAWTPVTVIGKNGYWYKVMTPKGNGYIYETATYIKQSISDNIADSTYFNNKIPFDKTGDSITYMSYSVKLYDNIWDLSLKFGIPDYELANANNISAFSSLKVGQILKVPVHHISVKAKISPNDGEILDWFSEAQYVFPTGKVGKFIDIETGKSFMAKRTMGANHSDTETLTTKDSLVMKEIFGGTWNWNRRTFILEVDGRRFAISVAGMPHAGVDGAPYLKDVANRSDNYGYGPNYDSIAGNGMNGHFDVYFLNCLKHKDNKIDSAHQYRVLRAGGLK